MQQSKRANHLVITPTLIKVSLMTTELQTRDILNPNIQISNRFSALRTDETDQNNTADSKSTSQDTSEMTGKKKKRKSKSKRKETTSNSDEHQSEPLADDQMQNEHQRQQSKTSVVIAGDSVIKYIKGMGVV